MRYISKKKRGLSLIELMTVVAIMGILSSISVPAYMSYRKSTKKNAYRADLLALHKGIQAFKVDMSNYCRRKTNPKQFSIGNVGMRNLYTSKFYMSQPKRPNFIGFSEEDCEMYNINHKLTNWDTTSVDLDKYTSSARGDDDLYIDSYDSTNLADVQKKLHEAIGITSDTSNHIPNSGPLCGVKPHKYGLIMYGYIGGQQYIGYRIDQNGSVKEAELGNLDTSSNIPTVVSGGICT